MPNKILIVDDQEQICFLVSMALRVKGYKTVVAENGEAALFIIKEHAGTAEPIDLLVCDIQMPKLTGEELIDKLNELGIKIPILVITAYGGKEMIVRLMRKGCRDFIDKPFEPLEIEERIGKILAEEQRNSLETKRNATMVGVGLRSQQIVHDLNNIMGGTLGYAEMALETIEQEHPSREYLTKLVKSASRAADFCHALLPTLQCTESPRPVSMEINALLERVAAVLTDIMPSSINIITKPAASPIWCTADSERVQQALFNLGINAAQAMPEGGRLTISCTLLESNGSENVRLIVSDTGIGIAPDTLDKLFEKGFSTKNGGHGMGLQTVKQIVDEHCGTIRVDSELGKGTIFTIDIPCSKQSPIPATEEKNART